MTRAPIAATTGDPTDWSQNITDASRLWADALTVIGLRTMRIMRGGRLAEREARQMVDEKFAAGFEFAVALAGGSLLTPEAATHKAMAIAGRKVRANRRRLG